MKQEQIKKEIRSFGENFKEFSQLQKKQIAIFAKTQGFKKPKRKRIAKSYYDFLFGKEKLYKELEEIQKKIKSS